MQAYELANKTLLIIDAHLKECEGLSTKNEGGGVGGLYPLRSRVVRFRSLIAENLDGDVVVGGSSSGIREDLARRYRAAVLGKDGDGICTVLNLMLRDLLMGDQVEQAQKLLSNATFPTESPPSNNQLLRYLYYSGRIRALRLEYTSSYSALSQCLRKCPTNTGFGFRIAV
jgi:26S proteasome regulatory subunit N3